MREQRRTVLIFAHECAPHHRGESTIGAQRPAQFAKYLPDFGWRAIVVCCNDRERGHGMPADFDTRVAHALRSGDPAASVTIPLPSLPWDGLLDRAWRRLQPRGERRDVLRGAARKPLTIAKLATGDYSQAWQPCARRAAVHIAEQVKVDACIGEHSPDAGLFLARWFSNRYGVPWVADFRDPVLWPFSNLGRRMYRPLMRRMLATAAQVINVTPYWSDLDRREFGRPTTCIPNGFDPDEFTEPVRPRNERFTIAYIGTISDVMRFPVFLDGLRQLQESLGARVCEEVRLVYRGRSSDDVTRWAHEAGVKCMVDSEPFVERHQAISIMQQADVLLLLSAVPVTGGDECLARGFYPGKTFEYFGARRPIMCVPGDQGLLDQLIRETRTGDVLASPRAIVEYLQRALERWRIGAPIPYGPDEGAVAQYSRRALSGRLAGILDAVLEEHSPELRRSMVSN